MFIVDKTFEYYGKPTSMVLLDGKLCVETDADHDNWFVAIPEVVEH